IFKRSTDYSIVLHCLTFTSFHLVSSPPAPSSLSPLSLHDALPISTEVQPRARASRDSVFKFIESELLAARPVLRLDELEHRVARWEEHTSELQSRFDLVCRLLLEKKKVHI